MTRWAMVRLAVTGAVVLTAPARADAAEPEPLHLAYEAPSACPDAEAFVKEVHARTSHFRQVDSTDGVRSFQVRIVSWGHRFLGDMRVFDRRGDVSLRSLQGAQCDEVAATLAFVVAVSIDPRASAAPPPRPRPPDAAPAPEPSPAPSLDRPPPPAPPPAPLPPPPGAVTFSPQPTDPLAPPSKDVAPAVVDRAPTPWHVSAGVGATAEGIAAPGVVAGDFAFLGVDLARAGVLSPEVRLAVAHATSGALDLAPGQAQLAWTFGRIDACPLRWPASGSLALRPCARADAGALSASATGLAQEQPRVRPWAALGASALVEWTPFTPLFVNLEGSLSAPLVREQFVVVPSPVVYQAPVLVAAGALAVGVRFP